MNKRHKRESKSRVRLHINIDITFSPCATVSVALFVAAFLFWFRCYPGHLAFAEQSQLFLSTFNYFASFLGRPGGIAEYAGQWLTQFFFQPWAGALIIAALIATTHWLTYYIIRDTRNLMCVMRSPHCGNAPADKRKRWLATAAAVLPAAFVWLFMLDRLSLLAFPIAFVTALSAIVGYNLLLHKSAECKMRDNNVGDNAGDNNEGDKAESEVGNKVGSNNACFCELAHNNIVCAAVAAVGAVTLYYIAGAVAFLFAIYVAAVEIAVRRNLAALAAPLIAAVAPLAAYRFVVSPVSRLYTTNCYYKLIDGAPKMAYAPDVEDALRYSHLTRYKKWGDIIARGERRMPLDMAARQTLMLALAQKGQLLERMFEFPIISPTDLISEQFGEMLEPSSVSDVYFSVGLINQAEQSAYNVMQTYYGQSVRSFVRLAECNIVKGDYRVAEKYLDALSQTLFYSKWAQSRRELLWNDQLVEAHRELGPARRRMAGKEYFYSNSNLDIILAHNTGANAERNINYDYFVAYLLLKNDLDRLQALFPANTTGRLPKAVQEALTLAWMSKHDSFEGMPWRIDPLIMNNAVSFAQAASNGDTRSLRERFGKTYWYYNAFAAKIMGLQNGGE